MNHHYLFISAHLDDAVISCGDYIYGLVQHGSKVTIATVFTGMGSELSMLARIIHKKFGLGADTMDVRRLEDIRAAEALGASVLHLGLLECIYRKNKDGSPVYGKLHNLFDTDWRNEAGVLEEIVKVMTEQIGFNRYDAVFVPLGIGRHVDHRLVREAAEQARLRSGFHAQIDFMYYEDLPYLCYKRDISWQSELAGGLHARNVLLPRNGLKAKIHAVLHYRSQIGLLWPSKYGMLKMLAGHARSKRENESGSYWMTLYASGAGDPVPHFGSVK